jgi:hypothetical protein
VDLRFGSGSEPDIGSDYLGFKSGFDLALGAELDSDREFHLDSIWKRESL